MEMEMTEGLIERLRVFGCMGDKYVREICHEASDEIESLRQQLAEAQAALVQKDEAIREIDNDFDHDADAHRYGTTCRCCLAQKALAITPGTEALEKWLGEPVAVCNLSSYNTVRWLVESLPQGTELYAKPKGIS